MPKTVLTYGTFDLFHIGHLRLLQRCRALGDRLVVGCSTDEFNQRKGKDAVIPYEQRVEVLRGCRYVDDVIAEETWEQKREDIRRIGASLLAMGDDWAGRFDDLSDCCSIVYLSRTSGISSTDTRRWASRLCEERLTATVASAERLLQQIRDL